MAWRKWALRPASAEVEVAAVKAAAVTTMANTPVIKDFDRIFIFVSIGFIQGSLIAPGTCMCRLPLAFMELVAVRELSVQANRNKKRTIKVMVLEVGVEQGVITSGAYVKTAMWR